MTEPVRDRLPRLVVGAAIVDELIRPTTLLSARRTAPAELAGRWELPGGKVEPGEEPLDALRREIREDPMASRGSSDGEGSGRIDERTGEPLITRGQRDLQLLR